MARVRVNHSEGRFGQHSKYNRLLRKYRTQHRENLNVRQRLQFGLPSSPAKRSNRGIDAASSTGDPLPSSVVAFI